MKPSNKKLVIILLGAPGAGKGTQAILLSEKFNLYYFETSKILEKEFENEKGVYEIEGKKYSTKEEKQKWQKGELCSPPFVTFLVKRKIENLAKEGKNLVLSGSPRTLYETERIMPLLERLFGKKNIKIVFLKISPKETLFRNTKRRICELMRHPIVYFKENEKLKFCPLDGSRLLKRKGLDDLQTIKVRLKEYKERTLPILEYLKKRGYQIITVSGSPPPAVVFKNILKKLKIQ